MDRPAQAPQSASKQQQGIYQQSTVTLSSSQSQAISQPGHHQQPYAQPIQPQPEPSSRSEAQGGVLVIGGVGTGVGVDLGGASNSLSTDSSGPGAAATPPTCSTITPGTGSKPVDNPPPPLPSPTVVPRLEDTSLQQAGLRPTRHSPLLPPPPPPPPPPPTLPLQNGFHHASPNGRAVSPATPSPSMSNHQPPVGPPRQQVGYSTQGHGAYTSPGIPSSGYGYPPVTSQGGPIDPYRANPTGLPPNPLALPSMRTFVDNPVQQQQHPPPPPPHHVMSMGSPMGPGGPPHMGYYMPQAPYSDMRFPLPPNLYDPRMQLSGGRHKKEIKRRTKTGCLTCRKRRIKCDETHPTCNNCKKSKRECLGYDPIFKQQPSPANLQPAPNSQPASSAPVPPSQTVPSSTTPSYTTQAPPVLTPTHYTASESPSLTYDSSLTSERPPDAKSKGFESSPYIDPALEIAGAHPNSLKTEPDDQKLADSLYLRGGGSTPTSPPHPDLVSTSASAYPTSVATKMKVDELIALGGTAPPFPAKLLPREVLEEVTKIYYEIYVPGLCQFFESQWYNFKNQGANPISTLLDNKSILSLFAEFLNVLRTVSTSDQAQMAYSGNLETRVVWGLTTLAYSIPQYTNPPRDDPLPDDDATELRNRLHVFETLLTGETLASNPLLSPPKNSDSQRKNEYEFWFLLAELLRQAGGSERERILSKLRQLLEGRENRDVLYSLATLRELSPRFATGYENKVEPHLDENEPRNKLHVATQFINAEASNTGGTTNVVRRFAFIATKAFINPGVNIKRKP